MQIPQPDPALAFTPEQFKQHVSRYDFLTCSIEKQFNKARAYSPVIDSTQGPAGWHKEYMANPAAYKQTLETIMAYTGTDPKKYILSFAHTICSRQDSNVFNMLSVHANLLSFIDLWKRATLLLHCLWSFWKRWLLKCLCQKESNYRSIISNGMYTFRVFTHINKSSFYLLAYI